MVKNLDHLLHEIRPSELNHFPLNYRQLRGDLIETCRIVRRRECALDFDEFFELAGTDRLRGHPFKLQMKLAHSDIRRNALSHRSTTIFAADEDIQEGQLVVLLLLHRELSVREDGVEMFFECQHLIPFDDDEGVINISSPELRSVVSENQRFQPLKDRLGYESRNWRTHWRSLHLLVDCSAKREVRIAAELQELDDLGVSEAILRFVVFLS
nr:unnamed protein product [Spirometra erinaceieuropaei]